MRHNPAAGAVVIMLAPAPSPDLFRESNNSPAPRPIRLDRLSLPDAAE
jgi:hypothetical protein